MEEKLLGTEGFVDLLTTEQTMNIDKEYQDYLLLVRTNLNRTNELSNKIKNFIKSVKTS